MESESLELENTEITRELIVNEITKLSGIISSITGYAVKNLLIEVSKITRDQLVNENIKPDFGLFRVNIFKYLIKYVDKVEKKSHIIVPLFIELYNKEFKNVRFIKYQNLQIDQTICKKKAKNKKCKALSISKDIIYQVECITGKISKPKHISDALKALLNVFAKFNKPKKVYCEEMLYNIYLELLMSTDLELQNGALLCLLSYKTDFLLAYEKNLKNLLIEKSLKDELVCFTVEEIYREKLVPFIIRILYGKLYSKATTRGKEKRKAIFRFLAKFQTNEIDYFFSIVFQSFFELINFNKNEIENENLFLNITKNYNITKTISLNKIRSVLGLINDIIIYLLPILNDSQIELLFILSMVCALLINLGIKNANKLSINTNNMLKSLRLMTFKTIINIFHGFNTHSLKQTQLNCLFNFILEPMICVYNKTFKKRKLNNPFIVQVSVARLFAFWSQNLKFFELLNHKFSLKLNNETPISLLCNTLLNYGTQKLLQTIILNSIHNLLINNFLLQMTELKKIINFLFKKIHTKTKVQQIYFKILNQICPFIEDNKMSEKIAITFLSYLSKKLKQEKIIEIFITLSALSKHLSNPIYALKRVTRFLSKLNDRSARNVLITFIINLKLNNNFPINYIKFIDLLVDLESYKHNRIDEPDYDCRYKAFEKLGQLYENNESDKLNLDFVPLFAHSHAFNTFNSEDLSLRKTGSNAFRHLIKYIAIHLNETNGKILLDNHIIPLILIGLNSINEYCRMEFVYSLADCIKRFSTHSHFIHLQCINKSWNCSGAELSATINNEIDENNKNEINFFENAIHIQVYKRQRAFYHLTEQLTNKEIEISSDILLRYIFPLFKPYLIETNSKLSALSDQSLKLFTIILKNASWKKYSKFLEIYFSQINDTEKTKGVVRTLTAILSAFHFDVINDNLSNKIELNSVNNNLIKNKKSFAKFGFDDSEESDFEAAEINEDEKEEEKDKELNVQLNDDIKNKQILENITKKIIPRLRQSLHPTQNLNHKKSHNNIYEIDDELLTRAPLVLAISKILIKLPENFLRENINGLVAALNRILMSRLANVRQGARKIMIQFIQILTPKYLPFIIKELRQTFLKGFQIHVMVFTIHAIIAALESDLKTGDLDLCFKDIFEICIMELFSNITEEKTACKAINLPEVKSNQASNTFFYLGKFISSELIDTVLIMIKDVINSQPKGNVIKKLSELLRNFSSGLNFNTGINIYELLNFILNILKQNLTEMLAQQQNFKSLEQIEMEQKKNGYRPQNCLLIPPEPKRIGALIKTSVKSKVSIFVEFSLQLLSDLLKHRPVVAKQNLNNNDIINIDETDQKLIALLNEFIPQIINCLKLKFSKIVALSLRSLAILLRYSLEKTNLEVQTLMDRLFVILSEYSGLGQAGKTPVIIELNQMLFKCFTLLIRNFPILTIAPKHIEILLNYAETDILDSHKQATSFSLIKSIISRKIEDEKVENIITYLSETSITCQISHVILLYISNHPSGKKSIEHWIEFFTNQIEYEYESGRVSALEMLISLFSVCTEETLSKFALFIFIKLATHLVNDKSEICCKILALVLQKLIISINESSFNDVFSTAKDWLISKKDSIQLLALKIFCEILHTQNVSLSNNTNNANVLQKLNEIVEIIIKNFSNFDFNIFENFTENVIISSFDYLTVYIELFSEKFIKILNNFSSNFSKLFDVLNECLRCIESPNLQLSSSKFVNNLIKLNELQIELVKNKRFNIINILCESFPLGLKGICLAFCLQLRNIEFRANTLADQAIKNLIILMKFLDFNSFNLICTKLAGICWREIVKESQFAIKRQNIFKLAAACVLNFDGEQLDCLCDRFLPLIYREMNRKSDKHTDELFQLATDVSEVFRKKLGEKLFSFRLLQCRKDASSKYEERRKKVKALFVLNPAAAALRKQKIHQRKRIAKKRKLDEMRPYRVTKRKKILLDEN